MWQPKLVKFALFLTMQMMQQKLVNFALPLFQTVNSVNHQQYVKFAMQGFICSTLPVLLKPSALVCRDTF
jgi:hypothetical protein